MIPHVTIYLPGTREILQFYCPQHNVYYGNTCHKCVELLKQKEEKNVNS
jgi:hypothetical protein